jgi:hypothetical protein
MRYRETGELHLDFHGTTNATINFISNNFGEKALHEIFFAMGQKVYKSIYEKLKQGDASELVEHWQYFFTREKGVFQIKETDGTIVLEVSECPAVRQLLKLGLTPSPLFCSQTILVNEALCEGTPFESRTEITGCGKCHQTISKRGIK